MSSSNAGERTDVFSVHLQLSCVGINLPGVFTELFHDLLVLCCMSSPVVLTIVGHEFQVHS